MYRTGKMVDSKGVRQIVSFVSIVEVNFKIDTSEEQQAFYRFRNYHFNSKKKM